MRVAAAKEAGLTESEVAIDLYTQGFKAGLVLEDPYDGAIVAHGRTALRQEELSRALRPVLQFLGVPRDGSNLRVHDGEFELRVAKRVADASRPALDSGKVALQLWIGFGLLGFAAYHWIATPLAAILWGVGLLLGAWQLRRGIASGRAMLSARLTVALGMLAHEGQLILPPVATDDGRASS